MTVIMRVRGAFMMVPFAIMRVRGAFMSVRGMVMRVGVRLLLADHELGGGDAGAQDAVGRDAAEIDREAAEGAAQVFERQTEIEEGAKNHVARGAGETVQIQGLCQPSTPSMLAKTEVLHVCEDDMVQNFHPHQDARRHQPLGQPDVVLARLRIA